MITWPLLPSSLASAASVRIEARSQGASIRDASRRYPE